MILRLGAIVGSGADEGWYRLCNALKLPVKSRMVVGVFDIRCARIGVSKGCTLRHDMKKSMVVDSSVMLGLRASTIFCLTVMYLAVKFSILLSSSEIVSASTLRNWWSYFVNCFMGWIIVWIRSSGVGVSSGASTSSRMSIETMLGTAANSICCLPSCVLRIFLHLWVGPGCP